MAKNIIKINGKKFKKEAFIIEEDHPAVGRILIVDDVKFKILDYEMKGGHRSGTFMKRMTAEDEEHIREYDECIEELSEKLTKKIDIKKVIKENMKNKPLQEIKTGLYILKAQENGDDDVEEEHIKGCYNYRIHKGNQTFDFMTGVDVIDEPR